jgi:hypothetical protein
MKNVYLGVEAYYNGCDQFDSVTKVFVDEVEAICWAEDWSSEDPGESRFYRKIELLE